MKNPSLPIVALVGCPNVGKSTLFNRFVGGRPALVEDRPGVTRDRRYGKVHDGPYSYLVADTGGLLDDLTGINSKIRQQVESGIKEASLVLYVMDGQSGLATPDKHWVQLLRESGKPVFYVVNKIDHQKMEGRIGEFYELGVETFYGVSAESGYCLDQLQEAILKTLQEQGLSPEEAFVAAPVFSIAILGRPNVGKSTLLNQLLCDERALVHDEPGTTRDPVHSWLEHDGNSYCLVDTAGIRKRGKISQKIEKVSVMRSLKSLDHAQCALVLVDATTGISEQDAHIAGYALERDKCLILLINKWDIAVGGTTQQVFEKEFRKLHFLSHVPHLYISAKTGAGTQKIWPTLARLKTQYEKRLPTGKLNQLWEEIKASHPPPTHGGRDIRLFYITQIAASPPTFVAFCNEPKGIHFSYERYLLNELRESCGLQEVPIKLMIKKR